MKKTLKRVICILLIVMFILPIFKNVALAAMVGQTKLIQYDRNCELNLQYWNANVNRWSYITCSYVYYENNGQQYPAYCLDKGSPGVGDTSSGTGLSVDPYNVNITKLMDDVRIWRTAINGYPYKTPEELGVVDKYDAFLATKQSIYCILYGTDPETYFHAPNDRARAIKNAIVNMVNIGRNGTQTPSNVEVSVSKIGNFVEDGEYYSQEYVVNTPVDSGQYTITSTSGLPSGSKITTTSNVEKTTFNASEHFKLRIPKNKLTQNLNAIIALQAKCKTYPVFFGETTVPGTQDYLITYDPYGDTSGVATLNITVQGKLNLEKISADNNIWTGHIIGSGVAGAEYTIKNASGQIVKTLTTNSEGKAQVSLAPGKYTIYESKSPNNFELDTNIYEFEISYHGSVTNFNVKEDVVEGGFFSAKKVSAYNNIWTGHKKGQALQGAKYGLYDANGNLIDTKTSTSDGTLWDNYKLKNGSYYILELSCPEWFEIDTEKHWFEIKNNEQKITVTTKDKVVEGGYFSAKKICADNNIWTGHKKDQALEGAKYGLYDANGNLIDTRTSTSDGTLWDNYKLKNGKYYILELSCPKWFEIDTEKHWFEIQNNEQKITVTTKDKVVEGGYFSAKKTSSLNNIWTGHKVNDPVAGATYGIFTLDGKIVEIDGKKAVSTSGSDGVIFNKFKLTLNDYYMQEIEPAPYFEKDETKYYFTVGKNEQVINIDVQNKPQEGGYVNLKKISSGNNLWTGHVNGDPVAGATYRIESLDKDWHIDVTTNENGEIVEPNFTSNDIELSLGNYKCYEISEPNGFKLNTEEKYFSLDKNEETIDLTSYEVPEEAGEVMVTKSASDYNYKNGVNKGEPVVGAIYKIYKVEDNTEVGKLTISKDGTSNKIILGKGSYYIKEEWVGEAWILNEEPVYFTIENNEDNKYFDFTNEPVPVGFLNINKTVLEDNTLNGDPEGMPLSGVKFELRDEKDNVLLTLETDEKRTI